MHCLRKRLFPELDWLAVHAPGGEGHDFVLRQSPCFALDIPSRKRFAMASDAGPDDGDLAILQEWIEQRRPESVEISLSWNELALKPVQELAGLLTKAPCAVHLNLSCCGWAPPALRDLCDAMSRNPHVASLNLGGARLDTDGSKALQGLLTVTQLSSLSLVGAKFPDTDDFQRLCEALAGNTSLLHLAIGNHGTLTIRQASSLSEALQTHRSLQELEIEALELQAGSAHADRRHVPDGLIANGELRKLTLRTTALNQQDCDALEALLGREDCRLRCLCIDTVDPTGSAAVVRAVLANRSLTQVHPWLYPDTASQLEATFRSCSSVTTQENVLNAALGKP